MSLNNSRRPPPWEVLNLVAVHLDPKTIAIASCVSKSWSLCLSSDHLWQPKCAIHSPFLSAAFKTTTTAATGSSPPPTVFYRRIYSITHEATRRRVKPPPKPQLSLSDLIFTVHLSSNTMNIGVGKECEQLLFDQKGLFRFNFDVNNEPWPMTGDVFDNTPHPEEVRVMWNVVLRGWEAVFTMMDCTGKVSFRAQEAESWLSEELPAAECCMSSGGGGSGIAADMKIVFCGGCRSGGDSGGGIRPLLRVEKVSMGILSISKWRYLSVEDGLRYLQHFLLPRNIPNCN